MLEPVESPVEYFDLLGQTKWSRGLQRSIMHWIGLTGKEEVLEVGCGPGQFAMILAQAQARDCAGLVQADVGSG